MSTSSDEECISALKLQRWSKGLEGYTIHVQNGLFHIQNPDNIEDDEKNGLILNEANGFFVVERKQITKEVRMAMENVPLASPVVGMVDSSYILHHMRDATPAAISTANSIKKLHDPAAVRTYTSCALVLDIIMDMEFSGEWNFLPSEGPMAVDSVPPDWIPFGKHVELPDVSSVLSTFCCNLFSKWVDIVAESPMAAEFTDSVEQIRSMLMRQQQLKDA